MRNHRLIALSLSVLFGLFILTTAATVFQIYRQELKTGVLASEEIDKLKIALGEDPKNEDLINTIRDIDLELRRENIRNRKRFEWAGYMAVLALVAWVASVRWFLSTFPSRKVPPLTAKLQDARRPLALRNRKVGLFTSGVAVGAIFLILGLMALFRTPELPPLDWGKAADASDGDAIDPDSPFKQNWPCFRGPGNLGFAGPGDWPTTWTVAVDPSTDAAGGLETEPLATSPSLAGDVNIAWRTEIPIFGLGSPVVWRDRVFLSGSYEHEADETDPEAEIPPPELRVLCVDRATGDILWDNAVDIPGGFDEEFEEADDSGYAATTPATDGKHIIAFFANGILAAFDFEGEQAWIRNLGIPDNMYGATNSLIVENNILLFQFDQGMDAEDELSKLYGIDTATGKTLFAIPRPVAGSWASPSIIRTPERVEFITLSDPWIIAYDPSNGKEFWRMDLLSTDMTPSSTYADGMLFVTSESAELYAIKPGGQGDVTETHVAWSHDDGMPDIASPVTDGKYVLQPASGGFLNCVSVERKETAWEKYLPESASASPILADGKVYLFCEDGSAWIFKMGDEYEHVGTGDVGEQIYATPAFVDSQIIVRGVERLICIETTD